MTEDQYRQLLAGTWHPTIEDYFRGGKQVTRGLKCSDLRDRIFALRMLRINPRFIKVYAADYNRFETEP